LGTGQLSLAKFLFITADDTNQLKTRNIPDYLQFVLERIHLDRDLHFHTQTTIDTLDYSGTGLNSGSKVVFAAYGEPIRTLGKEVPAVLRELVAFENPQIAIPGVIVLQTKDFTNYEQSLLEMESLNEQLLPYLESLKGFPMIVLANDASFTAATLNNFLWVAFTRCNPSHDIHGIAEFFTNKHWGCKGPLVIDARIKPHHAPELKTDPEVEKRIDRLFEKGGSLYGIK
jgi:4-hydroxy-3-polyprenylbenzoate decarboxylase